MTKQLGVLALAVVGVVPPAAAGEAIEPPAAVSPGHPSRFEAIERRCPTFSWGGVRQAETYELVVYRVGSEGEVAGEIVRTSIDGRASSWTPSLGRCLERGERYAWSLRARRDGVDSAWSAPSLFQVMPGPAATELQEAMAIVRRAAAAERARRPSEAAGVEPPLEPGLTHDPAEQTPAAASGAAPAAATLVVDGGVAATSFTGDGSGLAGVEAAGLACARCVAGAELADGAVSAAKIGEPCAAGQVLVRGAAGWECATLTAPACTAGDELVCYTGPAGTRGVGECVGGVRVCQTDSTWGPCAGEVTPDPAEICDGLDNTCDGATDEGDPAVLCPPTANVASTACDTAACVITGCDPLWVDADGDYANGCEAPAAGACVDGGAARPIVGPAGGDLVIRELMADPTTPLVDAEAEWFEVAVHADLDLNDLEMGTVFGTVLDQLASDACLTVQIGDVLLFARSADPAANGGLSPDHLFGFSLVNSGGDLHLAHGGNLVDAVSWGSGDVAAGRARNLPPAAEDAASNDDPANWCNVPDDAGLDYAPGNHGTPAAANVSCP